MEQFYKEEYSQHPGRGNDASVAGARVSYCGDSREAHQVGGAQEDSTNVDRTRVVLGGLRRAPV